MFYLGQRVRVLKDYNWAQFAEGVIVEQCYFPTDPLENRNGITRVVKGRKGPVVSYMVRFDEPQIDPDGDGPYKSADIEEEYLEAIE